MKFKDFYNNSLDEKKEEKFIVSYKVVGKNGEHKTKEFNSKLDARNWIDKMKTTIEHYSIKDSKGKSSESRIV